MQDDAGLAALAAQLKCQQLQHLSLNFSRRKQLTDAGLAALASQLKDAERPAAAAPQPYSASISGGASS
jgi:hypothetical protein